MISIKQSHLDFLSELAANNNREWFAENKERYDHVRAEVKIFFKKINEELSQEDDIEKFRMYRIYRDLRFSKDKTPYKMHLGMHLARRKPLLRGGYYVRIQPGNTIVAGGFWNPEKDDLLRLRKEFDYDPQPMNKLIHSTEFEKYFGQLEGEELKTSPRGFSIDSPAIQLLRKKQFLARRSFTDVEVLREDFFAEAIKTLAALRPWFNYMSEVLTTDENGVSLYE